MIKEDLGNLLSPLVAEDEGVGSSSVSAGVLAGGPNLVQKVRRETEMNQHTTQELALGLAGPDVDLCGARLHGLHNGFMSMKITDHSN